MKAGTYLVKLNTYETDSNSITTNKGFMNYNILIKQIPTSLDLIFETTQVEPGTNLKVKAILLDQTGEKIDSIAIITVKKGNNNILEQTEKSTNEYLEFPVAYNEPASNWTVVAVSNKLTKESKFKIIEKKDVKIERINETIIITNNGNIPYNDEIVIKIGNKTLSINISLGIDETERYELKASDGEYYIEVISGGKRKLSENAILTGKTIDIKELRQAGKSAMSHPVVWIFIIAILAFVAFMFLKKGYKRSFFGKMKFKKKDKPMNSSWENHKSNTERKITFDSKNPAHLSLSIKGEKQSSGILCLKLKNIKELNFKEGNVKENIEEIIKFAEDKKASTYETQENLFFIFSPTKTKTFKNEKTILDLAQKIKEKLKHHNRLFKQKIDYGLSIHHGDLIVSHQAKGMSFMGMGNLISQAKKISGISKGEILLDEKTKEKLGKTVKTEKFTQENLIFYRIKEIKDTEEHSKFLSNFVKKLESDKKEREL